MRALAILLAAAMVAGVARAAEEQKILVPIATTDGDSITWNPASWGWKTWSTIAVGSVAALYAGDAFGMQTWLSHNTKDGEEPKTNTPDVPAMPTVQNQGAGNTIVVQNTGSGTVTVTVPAATAAEESAYYLRPDVVQLTSEVYAAMDFAPRELAAYVCAR